MELTVKIKVKENVDKNIEAPFIQESVNYAVARYLENAIEDLNNEVPCKYEIEDDYTDIVFSVS